MWAFWRKREQQGGSEVAPDLFRDHDDRLYKLEREIKDLRLDGAAMYEKTLKLHERLRQRAAKMEQGAEEVIEVDPNGIIRSGGDPRHLKGIRALRSEA